MSEQEERPTESADKDIPGRLLVALVDSTDDALLSLDSEGIILTWNAAAELLLGHPRSEVVGRHCDLFWPFSRRNELNDVLGRLRSGSLTEHLSVEWLRRDGHLLQVNLALRAVREGAERLVGVAVCARPAAGHAGGRSAEELLSETQLRSLTLAMEQSPAAVMITDTDGRIEYVNRRFTEMTGYSAGEAIGQTPRLLKSGLTPPEEYARLWATVLTGAIWRGELSNRRKDGELYWHSTSISPVRNAEGKVMRFVAIQEDITEQRRVVEALRESEARWRRTVETASEGIWQVDSEHRTVYVNARLAEMLGYSEAEMLGRSVFDFTDAEGRIIAEGSLARRKQGIREQLEYKLQRRDGSTFWVLMSTGPLLDAAGQYVGALAMVTDISVRRAAQEALLKTGAYFRALIEEAQDLIMVLDPDGIFRYASPSHERILGYPPAELVGVSAFGFIHPDDVATVRQLFDEASQESGAVRLRQYRFRHRDGSWRVLEGIGRNLFGDPVVQGAVINGRDVTERVGLEAQFRQAQKMEAVGRFAGGVVHDFNNVLSAILGFSSLLQSDLPADHPSQVDVTEIRKATDRAAALNRQLLAFSRQQVLMPQLVDLNSIVTGMEGMVARLLREDIVLETRLAPEPATVMADPIQVEQILLNLAVNCRDAMPDGGRLTIATARVTLDADYAAKHIPTRPGEYVLITVSDTGVGMSDAAKAHAFEPFFTTKPEGQGTGLGLATVYGIVKQSGGFIWLYSELGHGTSVKIYLPWAAGRASATKRISGPQSLRGTETVLLADDNEPVRLIARRALERYGYTVLDGTASVALELATHHAGEIHLLLTDVVMPDFSGPELARRVRELRPGLKVLYVSGFTGNATLLEGVTDGERGFLQKPFTLAGLAEKVREVLDRAEPQGQAR